MLYRTFKQTEMEGRFSGRDVVGSRKTADTLRYRGRRRDEGDRRLEMRVEQGVAGS